MTRPRIGITTSDHKSRLAWLCDWLAVWRAGGKPIRLSPSRPVPEGLDGLVVGGDVSPAFANSDVDYDHTFEALLPKLTVAYELNQDWTVGALVTGRVVQRQGPDAASAVRRYAAVVTLLDAAGEVLERKGLVGQ